MSKMPPLLTREEEIKLAKITKYALIDNREYFEAACLALNISTKTKAGTKRKRFTKDNLNKISIYLESWRQKATDKLVNSHIRLVQFIARKYSRGNHSLFQDLCQEGTIGLIKAVSRYNEESGNRFSTYASFWVRQTIQLYLSNNGRTIRTPVYVVENVSKINKVRSKLHHELGRNPTDNEIAECLEINESKIRKFEVATLGTASLDFKIGEDTALGDIIKDEDSETPDEIIEVQERMEIINKVLSSLRSREEYIIRMRFGIGVDKDYTLEEIAKTLDLTKERIRQIESQALKKLQKGDNFRFLREVS